MEITIKGNPEEIAKLLQTIASSQEQSKSFGGGASVVSVGGNHAMKMPNVENPHDHTESLKNFGKFYSP